MVFLRGASNDPTFFLFAHGTNNIILINISTAHTPRPSLTSNHIHIYTNCMNTEVKFFLFCLNIWSSYFCVCSIDIPDLAWMLWVFFFCLLLHVFASQNSHMGNENISQTLWCDWSFQRVFTTSGGLFFHFSLHIWIFSYMRNVIDLNW